jgi:ribosomal-protein-alanine N-acetyltransferase
MGTLEQRYGINFTNCVLKPMDEDTARVIQEWAYPAPYDVYNSKGKKNGYLLNRQIWGTEQFYLTDGGEVLAQVACQYAWGNLWVGWSLVPEYCGNGSGASFVLRCAEEIRRVKSYSGPLYLRVAAWNRRAITAYEKAGFVYTETILDEMAGSGKWEDFWVMKQNQ